MGRNCANRRPDVLLVQFLLKVSDESPAHAHWWKVKRGRASKIDGIYGEHTQSLIDQIQEQVQPGRGDKVARDGRVDPIANSSYYGARTGVLMTMVVLNLMYMESTGSSDISSMPHHPLWPKELSNGLQLTIH